VLRREGYIEKLRNIMTDAYDKMMSVK